MTIIGNIDTASVRELSGWVGDTDNPQTPVIVALIHAGTPLVATIAAQDRPDIATAFRDTRKGFSLDLASIGELPESATVHIISAGSSHVWKNVSLHRAPINQAHARWLEDEPAPHLTWGMMMTGHDFFSIVRRSSASNNLGRVVEIGPGYGRLLSTMLEEKWNFQSYTGIEMSSARVRRLTNEFGSARITFKQGDASAPVYPAPTDTVVCSSTTEHIYPDCNAMFAHLSAACAPGAHLFIDFPNYAEDPEFRSQAFSPGPSGEWVRYYPRSEVAEMCANNGMRMTDWLPYQSRTIGAPPESPDEVNRDSIIFAGTKPVGVSWWMAVIRKV